MALSRQGYRLGRAGCRGQEPAASSGCPHTQLAATPGTFLTCSPPLCGVKHLNLNQNLCPRLFSAYTC